MLIHRFLTALVAVPILILYIWKGGAFLFTFLICLVACISINEYFHIVFHEKETSPLIPKLSFVAYFSGILIVLGAYQQSPLFIMTVVILNLLASACLTIYSYEGEKNILDTLFRQATGVLYIPLFLSCLVFIRESENGVTWIFYILYLVAAGDTGAYFAGTYLGKKKLCPKVSPGKTVEGFLGAMLTVFILGLVFKYYLLPELSWFAAVLILPVIAVTGVLGDLFESVLKREGKIKDSGSILPGHGGLLDRIDGLLFVSPLFFWLKEIFVG